MVATVTVDHPIRPARPEDCRFQVTLQGSPALRRANGGVLDHALEVVLVRRDAPGLRYLTKDDPRALLAPDRPMPRDRPPLPPGCETMDAGLFTDTLDLGLLDYGAAHDGAARYYVLASFADAWADPRPLWIDHPDGPLPSRQPPSLPPRDPSATDVVQALLTQPGVTLRYYPTGGVARVAGAFRVAAAGSAALSLVAQHLRPTGGVSAACFALDALPLDGDLVGTFVVPLSALFPEGGVGPVRLLAFVGDELAAPLVFELPDARV